MDAGAMRYASNMRHFHRICVIYTSSTDSLTWPDDVKDSLTDTPHGKDIPIDEIFEITSCCCRRDIGELLVIRIGDLPGLFREEHSRNGSGGQ